MPKKLFLLTLLLALTALAAQKQVDILITHGTVLTMAGPNIDDGAVAIDKGSIAAVGPAAQIAKSYAGKETINARGMAVLPGFVNTHTHAPMVLFRGIADDRDLMDWLQHYIFPAEAKNVTADFVRWGTRLAAAGSIRSRATTLPHLDFFH